MLDNIPIEKQSQSPTLEELKKDRKYSIALAIGSVAALGASVYATYASLTGKISVEWYPPVTGAAVFAAAAAGTIGQTISLSNEIREAKKASTDDVSNTEAD